LAVELSNSGDHGTKPPRLSDITTDAAQRATRHSFCMLARNAHAISFAATHGIVTFTGRIERGNV
jgi:hypothetical protein